MTQATSNREAAFQRFRSWFSAGLQPCQAKSATFPCLFPHRGKTHPPGYTPKTILQNLRHPRAEPLPDTRPEEFPDRCPHNPGTFLVLLIKKAGTENYVIPTGSTSIDVNDQLIIIADADKSKKLMASFGVK